MIVKISKSDIIKAKMEAQGNSTYLDKPEDIEAIMEMNGHLEDFRREYQVKNRNSQISASSVILTA